MTIIFLVSFAVLMNGRIPQEISYLIISLVAFAAFIFNFSHQNNSKLFLSGFAVLIFSLVCFIYSLLSLFVSAEVKYFAQLVPWVFCAVSGLYLASYKKNISIIKNSLGILVVLNFIIAIMQMANSLYGFSGPFGLFDLLREWDYLVQFKSRNENIVFGRAIGLTYDPNILGFFSALMVIFFLAGRSKYKSNFFGYIAVLTLLMSSSRGSISGLVGAFFVTTVCIIYMRMWTGNMFIKKSIILKATLSFLAILIFSMVIFYFPQESYSPLEANIDRLLEIFGVLGNGVQRSANLVGRNEAWSDILSYVSSNPFGTIIPPGKILTVSADNQFIYFYAQGGIIFLIFFIILISMLFVDAVKQLIIFRDGSNVLLVSFLAVNSLTFVSFNALCIYFFWLIFGFQKVENCSSGISNIDGCSSSVQKC